MKAVLVRDGALVVEEIQTPKPGPGQVLVKVRSCGICGSDLHLFKFGPELVAKAKAANLPYEDISQGLVMGHEFVGELVEFGPDCQHTLSLGDRVSSMPFLQQGEHIAPIGATIATTGAYAEYMLLTESILIPVPEDMADDAAALAEPLAIGVHAVAKAVIAEDDVALVIGCGPIGLAVIASLRMHGVKKIIASDYSSRRRALAEEMGASEIVDPGVSSPYEVLQAAGSLSNVIFECVGVRGLISQIVNEAPRLSRIIVAGVCMEEDAFQPMIAVSKELQLQFVTYYSPEEFAEALHALAENRINWRPWVTGKVNLYGVANAFEELKNPELHAKILIEPSPI